MMKEEIDEIVQAINGYTFEQLVDEFNLSRILMYKERNTFNGERLEQACRERAKAFHRVKDFKNLFDAYKRSRVNKAQALGGNVTQFTDQPIQLNCGQWKCDDAGIRITRSLPSGDIKTETVSHTPILITEILKNIEKTTDNEKVRLAYCDDGIWKSIVCDNSTLCESRQITKLSGVGIDVTSNTAKLLIDYIRDIKTGNRDTIPVRASIDRLGWTDKGDFAPYSDIAFDGESNYKEVFDAITAKGDYGKWQEKMQELRKNIYFRLIMDASLASPLLSKLNALPFILHSWGGTGSGKTVALACAVSIWGNPAAGKLWRSMNNTSNFSMQLPGMLHHLPVGYDELQVVKDKDGYDKLIMRLTEGIDRGRMQGHVMTKTATWCNAFITSGEEPIVKANSGGGAVNRVIELDCSEHKVVESGGNKVIALINENYGHAGREYINVVKDFKALRGMYEQYLDDILAQSDTTEKQANSMAAILTADAIATMSIFPSEMPLEVSNILSFITSKDVVDVAQRAYESVLGKISINSSRFSAGSLDDAWGKFDGKDSVYIHKLKLTEWLKDEGFDFKAVKKRWANLGYMIPTPQGKYIHSTSVNGIRGQYIKLAMMADWEEL